MQEVLEEEVDGNLAPAGEDTLQLLKGRKGRRDVWQGLGAEGQAEAFRRRQPFMQPTQGKGSCPRATADHLRDAGGEDTEDIRHLQFCSPPSQLQL